MKSRREARNLLSNKAPLVSVELEDGTKYFRGHPRSGGHYGDRLTGFAPGYALCPTVLSRSDIEVFWKLAPSERMRFFFDHLRDSPSHAGYIALDIERSEIVLRETRESLLEAQIDLATVANLPVSEIPNRNIIAFERWRSTQFPERTAGTSRRKRARTPKRIQAALTEFENQLKRTAKLKQHIASQKRQAGFTEPAPPVISTDIPTLLHNITQQVSDDFSQIARLPHIKKIEITASQSGGGDGLDIRAILPSGRRVDPVQVLSEGSLDLLALLIMLGVALECAKGAGTWEMGRVWASLPLVRDRAWLR